MPNETTGSLNEGSVKDRHCADTMALQRDKLEQRVLGSMAFDFLQARVWDAVATLLPSDGVVESAVESASYYWDPNSADDTMFVAVRAYRVLGITSRIEVAGTDGGAVTAAVKKAASGTDIASGTALHSSTIDLKGTVNTNQALTLSATSSDLDIAAGTAIGIDFTGTLTAARGCVTVLLQPAASADDLRLVTGTFATAPPTIESGDLKAAGSTTRRGRFLLRLPDDYEAAETVVLRIAGGMKTTVADVAATVDAEVYRLDDAGSLGGSPTDLCATAAQSINNLTAANKDFTITATDLVAGSVLDVRISVLVNDAATATAVIGRIVNIWLLSDRR